MEPLSPKRAESPHPLYTLYASPGSCSLAPHIALEEIGRPYVVEMMPPDHHRTRSEAFRRINPKGRVPVLAAQGFLLTETPAILLHLALTNPAAGLLRPRSDDIVRAAEWTNWLAAEVHAVAVRLIWRTEHFATDASVHRALIESGNAHLLSAFGLIEGRLRDRRYALGESYTLVDPYLLVFFRWGSRMNIDMRKRFPCWTSHAERLERRDAVRRAMTQQGVSLWR